MPLKTILLQSLSSERDVMVAMITMMEPRSRPAQREDDSELIIHMHFHDPHISELEMELGIFANITGMSGAELFSSKP
jgi:hypothetical protein